MIAITFDTLKFSRTLKESGLPESQADAIAQAFKDAQGEAELATKADIREVKAEIREVKAEIREVETRLVSEIKLLKWMMSATFGAVIFILLRLLLPISH